MERNEPLDLTNHTPQILREFFKKRKGESTYTATDLYEVLELSEKKFKENIKLAIEGLLKDIEECNDWSPIPLSNEIKKLTVKNLIKKWFPDIFKEENE